MIPMTNAKTKSTDAKPRKKSKRVIKGFDFRDSFPYNATTYKATQNVISDDRIIMTEGKQKPATIFGKQLIKIKTL